MNQNSIRGYIPQRLTRENTTKVSPGTAAGARIFIDYIATSLLSLGVNSTEVSVQPLVQL